MRTDSAPKPIHLADYAPFPFEIESVRLDFALDPELTTVRNRMTLRRRAPGDLRLDGDDIRLVSVSVDGRELARADYALDQTALTLSDLPDACEVEVVSTCVPSENTTLMGLYVSGGRFCTQCEAEGFRRITFYPDRPDVLSVFTTRIQASRDYPYLLSNGNLTASGDLPDGRHFAEWHDPFPKPAYLFALVAGEFDVLSDSFTTRSGREVALEIYIDPGQLGKARYAMDALKRSMRWDEETFGREYDLDRFMVVAVRDFNFGAMENKGLNIFNSSLLMADAATTTDLAYERIESVVAHEYFHNWTGNRVTCRDWFQLCLKEGFTVFRDQQFSADQRDPTVQRIKDVRALRARQFPEDQGPLAHPVRPESFVKIDNFYTATVYEKGAEIIRMLLTLLGEETFRAGCDLYFERCDGTAATVEQFYACFEEVSGRDLIQFRRWYSQAGTPIVTVETRRERDALHLTLSQTTPPTPGQETKHPLVIPILYQIIGDDGPVTDQVLHVLDTETDEIVVELPAGTGPVTPSLFQHFSAPVILRADPGTEGLLRLMASDPDGFNRWEAGQTIAQGLVATIARSLETDSLPETDHALRAYVSALGSTLSDGRFSNAYKALVLTPPSQLQQYLGRDGISDPYAVDAATDWLARAVGDGLHDQLLETYDALRGQDDGFDPGAVGAGRRALRNRALALLADARAPQAAALAISQLADATTFTDEIAALRVLSRLGGRRVDFHLDAFAEKHAHEPLVIDQWFSLQAARAHPRGLAFVEELSRRDDYTRNTPNRVRALLGGFAMGNVRAFHSPDGSGYAFLATEILDMETRNPQIAARMLGLFEFWPKVDAERQAAVRRELSRVREAATSDNLREIADKLLG